MLERLLVGLDPVKGVMLRHKTSGTSKSNHEGKLLLKIATEDCK
jgi:hypothetical protein